MSKKQIIMLCSICALVLLTIIICIIAVKNKSSVKDYPSSVVQSLSNEKDNEVVKVNSNRTSNLVSVNLPETIKANSKTEIDINIDGITGNPYDFESVDVYGEFIAPSGKTLVVPAFYYKDYEMSFKETDYTKEYALKGWYGNVLGVFDKGDENNVGRGVAKVTAQKEYSYITQKSVNLSGNDTRSTNVFFSVKKVPGTEAKGYSFGLYSDTTGKAAYTSIDQYVKDEWVRVSLPFEDLKSDGQKDSLFTMTAVKFFGDENTTGSIMVKDFGIERPNGKFPTIVDSFEVTEYSDYLATDKYNGSEILTETGDAPNFKLRFNAPETGDYRFRIMFKENGELTAKYTSSFTALENQTKGIIKVEPNIKRNFIYENGEPFLAVGPNTGWYQNMNKRTYEFYDLFEKMSDAQMNWGRVFMLDYQFAQFNYKDGTNNFSSRQDEAYRLDKVVEKAEQEGIYLALIMLVHGQFYEELNYDAWPSWNSNPFNKSAGGYLEKPWDFFTDKNARSDFKKLARYVIARWGYSENIFAWELWNEVNHLRGYNDNYPDAVDWHKEMARYVKGIDAYGHLVTTSIGVPNRDDPMNSIEELDYNNIHAYSFENYSAVLVDYQEYMMEKFNKPVLISEVGIGGDNGEQCFTMDPEMIYIKQSIWSGSFSGAGGGMSWWWETINKRNAYDIYIPVRKYFEKVDSSYVTMPSITSQDYSHKASFDNPLVSVIGYKSKDKVYGYMYDTAYNSYNINTPINQESLLTFNNMDNGNYDVQLFDTVTGEFSQLPDVTVTDGSLAVKVGTWTREIAVLIHKK